MLGNITLDATTEQARQEYEAQCIADGVTPSWKGFVIWYSENYGEVENDEI